MRWLVAAAFVSTLLLPPPGHAQERQSSTRRERLFLSAGPGWTHLLKGLHLRAEYHLTPLERVVGVRVHLGAFWTPTQSYSVPSALYGDGTTFEGSSQRADFDFGVTWSLTPWPRARVSPYIVGGLAGLQQWSHGSGYYRRADGSQAAFIPSGGGTRGLFAGIVGVGVRARVGGRLLQFEARQLRGTYSTIGLGTALHF